MLSHLKAHARKRNVLGRTWTDSTDFAPEDKVVHELYGKTSTEHAKVIFNGLKQTKKQTPRNVNKWD